MSWVRSVLEDLRTSPQVPTVIFKDNLGAISRIAEVQGLRKAKHVVIRYHHVLGEFDTGIIQVEYCENSKNRAESFTKVLVGIKYNIHWELIGCIDRKDLS